MTIQGTDGGDNASDDDNAEPFKGLVTEAYTDGNLDKPVKEKANEDTDAAESGRHADSADREEQGDGDGDGSGDGETGEDAEEANDDSDSEAEDEADEDEADEDETDEDEDVDPPKPKKSVSERIGELTKARRDAEARADKAERDLAALRNGKGKATGQDDKAGELTAEGEEDTSAKRPEAKDYQYGEIDPEFIEALADWKIEQKLNERDKKANDTRLHEADRALAQEFVQNIGKVYDAGKKLFPKDFQAKVIDGANKGQWDLTTETALLISKSKVGAQIAYHLATNHGVAAEIAKLDPLDQARRVGRLEARYLEKSKKPTPKPPKARAMPDAVRGAGGKFSTPSDTKDFNAFEKMARQAERTD